jgi:hypothetical protein
MANTMTQKQQAKQAMLDMQKEQAARPRTGAPGPEMPTFGPEPEMSPADKAREAVELAKKVTANTPKPTPVKDARKNVQDERSQLMAAKTQLDMAKQARDQMMAKKAATGKTPSARPVPKPTTGIPDLDTPMLLAPPPTPGYDMPPPMAPAPRPFNMGNDLPPIRSSPTPEPGYNMPSAMPGGKPGGALMTIPKAPSQSMAMRKGGAVRSKPQTKFASGGSVGGASRRGDGIAQRGKTKGRMC